MTLLTRQQQRDAEAREKAATQGPLKLERYKHGGGRLHVDERYGNLVADFYYEGDREFYTHVRTDAPLAYVTLNRLWPLVEALAKQRYLNPTMTDVTDPEPALPMARVTLKDCGHCLPCQARQVVKERG